MQNVILHIDMNSYFASVEQQDNPTFRGKVLGVCEHLGGIIIAASIEAKRWGIKTGTPVWEAKKLYPKIILTKTHPDRYRLYTNRLMKILADYTDYVEQYSIDEAFIDATKVCNIKNGGTNHQANPFEEAARIAQLIKSRMKKEVGDYLTCSVGIAENKLLAKIASDMKKPDGLVMVENSKSKYQNPKNILNLKPALPAGRPGILNLTADDLYERLKLTDIPGIAHRQEKRLNGLGIKTLKDLRDYPRSKLVAKFGIMGHHLHEMGNLRSSWKPKVEQEETIKSIGHMYTLPREFREKKFFVPVLYKLCEMVARRLRQQQLWGSTIHFHIHDLDHECYGQSKRLGYYTYDGREIFLEAMRIFESKAGETAQQKGQFKLIGVTMAGLAEAVVQKSLFPQYDKKEKILPALDKINEKYGDFTIARVPVRLAGKAFADSIGFGRIKEQVRLASFR